MTSQIQTTRKKMKINNKKKMRETTKMKTKRRLGKIGSGFFDDIIIKTTKTKSRKNKMYKLKCGPKIKQSELDFTCFDDKTIFKLRSLWNMRHKDAKIESNNPREIWEKLKLNLSTLCNKESCWLKQQFVNGELDKELKTYFAPVSPKEWKKNPNEWLSSTDILAVMKQYEDVYSCFDFIGPSPIDFDVQQHYGECVWQELCGFSISDQIKNGKYKIGMIFNLDPHTMGGSHWVSMFINIKKGKIFFFDSVGETAPKEIMVLVKRIQKQGKLLKKPINFTFDQNHPTEHQYGNTECGIYSLYFIVHMLEDKHTAEYFKKHILSDKYMETFRKVYFNDEL